METAALIIQGRDDYTGEEPVAGVPPLWRLVKTFKLAGIRRVVLACDDEAMEGALKHAKRLEAEFIHPSRKKRNKASYRVNAFRYLKGKCGRLLLAPAHYPLFDIGTVKLMAEADAGLAAPVYKGRRGYPMLLSPEFFDTLIENDGDVGRLLEENDWLAIEVDDEGAAADVTGPVDAGRIAAGLSLRRDAMPEFKLTISREAVCYGPGIHEIIRLVGESGSLMKAYSLMGIAGSAAVEIIREKEAGLGFRLFKTADVKNRGSIVTAEAREYAEKYKAFHEDCAKIVEDSYRRHFG